MKENLTLEEFVKNADPIPDESYDNHLMARIWEKHMEEATVAHLYAHQALRKGKTHVAYWNALHAIGSYAAAHVAVTKDNKMEAMASATFAYFAAIAKAQHEHPQLHWDYGNLKGEVDNIDWQDIRTKIDRIRSDIGELMDELGELGADEPSTFEYTNTKLGIIQNALGVADRMILPVMPPKESAAEFNAQ
jgi:hypothetical protein